MTQYGGHSMHGNLRRVLVRRPDDSFAVDDPQPWNYTSTPHLEAARAEHDALVESLRAAGADVIYHDAPQAQKADAIFVFDPVLITNGGVLVLSMGKSLRRGEEAALASRLEDLGLPILGRLEGEARAEGGDLLWLDKNTLVAGRGFRTNDAGIEQMARALAPVGVGVIAAHLAYFQGPAACLHLLSTISIVDEKVAVIYPPLLPVPVWQMLQERDFRLIEVPEEEFLSMGPNVLALGGGRCIMLEGNPVTQQGLEAAGCTVTTYRGNELSLKAEGGPTCLTQPLWRD